MSATFEVYEVIKVLDVRCAGYGIWLNAGERCLARLYLGEQIPLTLVYLKPVYLMMLIVSEAWEHLVVLSSLVHMDRRMT